MAKSLKYFLNAFLLFSFITIISCHQQEQILYNKEFTSEQRLKLSEQILNSAGTNSYYQGTVAERQIIKEAQLLNHDNPDVWREFGVPYLKRGIASEANLYYTKAIQGDPEEWLGYKAYCWLYFYRDYENVLLEIDKFDALTPNFVDYPQATSVDYMRGICYLQLDQYQKAIHYFEKHLEKEINEAGAEYVSSLPFQLLAISYHKNNQYDKANQVFLKGIKYNNNTADIWYYHALNLFAMKKNKEAKDALLEAEYWLKMGNVNIRAYVEEFYQIYQEDIIKTKNLYHL